MATMYGEGYDMPILGPDGFPITVNISGGMMGEGSTTNLTSGMLWGTGAGGYGALQTVSPQSAFGGGLSDIVSEIGGTPTIEDVIAKIPTTDSVLSQYGISDPWTGGLESWWGQQGWGPWSDQYWDKNIFGPFMYKGSNDPINYDPNNPSDRRVWDYLRRESIDSVTQDQFQNALLAMNNQFGGGFYGPGHGTPENPTSAADWARALGAQNVTDEEIARSRNFAKQYYAEREAQRKSDAFGSLLPLAFLAPLGGMLAGSILGAGGLGATMGMGGTGAADALAALGAEAGIGGGGGIGMGAGLGTGGLAAGGGIPASWLTGGAGGAATGAGAVAGNYAPVVDLSTQLGLTSGTPFTGPALPSLGNAVSALTGSGALGNLVGGGGLLSNVLGGLTGTGGGGGGLLSNVLGGLTGGGGLGGNSGLGALLGGLAGYLGTPDDGETTVTRAPWGPQQPYLLDAFSKAQGLYNQQSAQENPLLAPAMAQMQSTIAGDYLMPESNPYLSAAVDQALGKAQGRVNSAFGGESFGGSANTEWLGRTLANEALPYYLNNYNTERNRQFGAAGLAPNFATNYYQAQSAPLNQYANIVGQGYGSQVTEPYYTNPLLGGIGGAMAGSQLGGLLGGIFG